MRTVNDDERDAFNEAMKELDRLDGTVQPVIVRLPDGFYDHRIVIDKVPPAGLVSEASDLPITAMEWHYEPCRIPRFRDELLWLRPDDHSS